MKALSVQQLTKVYPSGVVAIDRVDLEVAAGDFLALLGPNGAGKTSLIGMVASLLIKTSGAITVFGHSLDREPNAVKSAIGLVPQELNLNQWDKVANIVMHQAGFYGIPPLEPGSGPKSACASCNFGTAGTPLSEGCPGA